MNQTFFSYDFHIRLNSSSIVKTLAPGDRIAIPSYYNNFKFQIRIAPIIEKQNEDNEEKKDSHFIKPLSSQISGSRMTTLVTQRLKS